VSVLADALVHPIPSAGYVQLHCLWVATKKKKPFLVSHICSAVFFYCSVFIVIKTLPENLIETCLCDSKFLNTSFNLECKADGKMPCLFHQIADF